MTTKHQNGTLLEKRQASIHFPPGTTPNCLGIMRGVMRNTSPAGLGFWGVSFLVDPSAPFGSPTFLFGTLHAFGSSATRYLLAALGKLFPLNPDFDDLVWEGWAPHPRKNLGVCRASSSCPRGCKVPPASNGSQVWRARLLVS